MLGNQTKHIASALITKNQECNIIIHIQLAAYLKNMLQLMQNLCKLQLLNISGFQSSSSFYQTLTDLRKQILKSKGISIDIPPQFLGFSAPSVPNAATSASQVGVRGKHREPMQCGQIYDNHVYIYIHMIFENI